MHNFLTCVVICLIHTIRKESCTWIGSLPATRSANSVLIRSPSVHCKAATNNTNINQPHTKDRLMSNLQSSSVTRLAASSCIPHGRVSAFSPLLTKRFIFNGTQIARSGPGRKRRRDPRNETPNSTDAVLPHNESLKDVRKLSAQFVPARSRHDCRPQLERKSFRGSCSPLRLLLLTSAFGLSVICARRCSSNSGISILTGHTSRQAPHRLDAYGNFAALFKPINCGVMTAPIGPG